MTESFRSVVHSRNAIYKNVSRVVSRKIRASVRSYRTLANHSAAVDLNRNKRWCQAPVENTSTLGAVLILRSFVSYGGKPRSGLVSYALKYCPQFRLAKTDVQPNGVDPGFVVIII